MGGQRPPTRGLSPAAPLALTVVELLGEVYTQPDLRAMLGTISPVWAPASDCAQRGPFSFSALNYMTKEREGRTTHSSHL